MDSFPQIQKDHQRSGFNGSANCFITDQRPGNVGLGKNLTKTMPPSRLPDGGRLGCALGSSSVGIQSHLLIAMLSSIIVRSDTLPAEKRISVTPTQSLTQRPAAAPNSASSEAQKSPLRFPPIGIGVLCRPSTQFRSRMQKPNRSSAPMFNLKNDWKHKSETRLRMTSTYSPAKGNKRSLPRL